MMDSERQGQSRLAEDKSQETVMKEFNTKVVFVNGEVVVEILVAPSLKSAARGARRLAIARKPYAGSPVTVTVTERGNETEDK